MSTLPCHQHVRLHLALLLLVVGNPFHARAADASLETLPLFTPDEVKQWAQTEASLEASTAHSRSGKPAMHWHVTVDYFNGEAKYPIGWPRITHPIKLMTQRNWSGWDYLHLLIYTETSRDALPHDPAYMTVYNPDRTGAYQYTLNELKKGQWVEINIPITDIPRPSDIRLMQFNISDARYRHQDQVDFYIDELSLVRYSKPTLLNFTSESAVLFNDTSFIPVTFKLTGMSKNSSAEITFEIKQGNSIKASSKVQLTPGEARVSLHLGQRGLSAGDYEVTAHVPNAEKEFVARFRLVDSPWK